MVVRDPFMAVYNYWKNNAYKLRLSTHPNSQIEGMLASAILLSDKAFDYWWDKAESRGIASPNCFNNIYKFLQFYYVGLTGKIIADAIKVVEKYRRSNKHAERIYKTLLARFKEICNISSIFTYAPLDFKDVLYKYKEPKTFCNYIASSDVAKKFIKERGEVIERIFDTLDDIASDLFSLAFGRRAYILFERLVKKYGVKEGCKRILNYVFRIKKFIYHIITYTAFIMAGYFDILTLATKGNSLTYKQKKELHEYAFRYFIYASKRISSIMKLAEAFKYSIVRDYSIALVRKVSRLKHLTWFDLALHFYINPNNGCWTRVIYAV